MPSQGMDTPRSKRELFDSVQAHWPKEFRILDEQPVLPTLLTEPSDHEAYLAIEHRLSPKDEWQQLAAWAFHQALGKLVRQRHREAGKLVRSEDVSFQSFDILMKSNLSDSSWDAERTVYERLPLK
jgi:hypothetical protein